MGFFDKVKNALGGSKEEKDVTVGPSQLLREAGIDPSGLKFGFGTGTIAVSGTIADESERAKIMEVLSGIAGIDTRRLTRILREQGAQGGAIVAGPGADANHAIELARSFPGMQGMDLAREVTTAEAYSWTEGSWLLDEAAWNETSPERHVVAYDFGVKRNILRMLADRGCRVSVVPAQTPAADALKLAPDGIFLCNGPGDPEPCGYAIEAIRTFIDEGVPMFGICLGHQLLGLAAGARTVKMKFGHHGANHPVQDLANGQVMITSQNHGFAVDED